MLTGDAALVATDDLIGPVAANDGQRRTTLGGDLRQRRQRFGRLSRRNDRHARLDDAALLGSDLGQRVAQQLCMVEAQAGDDRHQRRQHVGGVEPPAQSHLNDSNIDGAGREIVKGNGRDDLEPGDARRGLDGRAHMVHDGNE